MERLARRIDLQKRRFLDDLATRGLPRAPGRRKITTNRKDRAGFADSVMARDVLEYFDISRRLDGIKV